MSRAPMDRRKLRDALAAQLASDREFGLEELPVPRGVDRVSTTIELPATPGAHYYLRVTQSDGERAWTSPIFLDDADAATQ